MMGDLATFGLPHENFISSFTLFFFFFFSNEHFKLNPTTEIGKLAHFYLISEIFFR